MVLQSGTTKWTIHNMRTKRALRESVPHRVTHIIHPASNRRDLSFDYMLALALKRWNPSHRSKSTNSLQWPLKRKEETKHATSLYVTLEMNNKYKMTTNKYKVQTISHVEKQEIISFFFAFFSSQRLLAECLELFSRNLSSRNTVWFSNIKIKRSWTLTTLRNLTQTPSTGKKIYKKNFGPVRSADWCSVDRPADPSRESKAERYFGRNCRISHRKISALVQICVYGFPRGEPR